MEKLIVLEQTYPLEEILSIIGQEGKRQIM
jgi:hypothetical protein